MANMGGPKAHRGGPKAHQTPPEGLEFEGRVAPPNSSYINWNIELYASFPVPECSQQNFNKK